MKEIDAMKIGQAKWMGSTENKILVVGNTDISEGRRIKQSVQVCTHANLDSNTESSPMTSHKYVWKTEGPFPFRN
jgi:hypothetical protein